MPDSGTTQRRRSTRTPAGRSVRFGRLTFVRSKLCLAIRRPDVLEVMAMAINDWWRDDPSQIYWMETTGRSDLGANLLAPQLDDADNPNNPGYVLVKYVNDGDVVLHWDTNTRALVAWSRANGGYWEDMIFWASAPGGNAPTDRPAWSHGLDGPYWFGTPIALPEIQAAGAEVGRVHDSLLAGHQRRALYFPFTRYAGTWERLRGGQPYMSKFPAELVTAIPRLAQNLRDARCPTIPVKANRPSGPADLDYEVLDESVPIVKIDVYEVDPSVVERGLQGHRRTQNALANWVRQRGLHPRRPGPTSPALYDLAWKDGHTLYVCEVKSVTEMNEEKQLRLGLGQVLRYRHLLQRSGVTVVPVLVPERAPKDPTWNDLCRALGVRLSWPGAFDRI